MKKINSTILIVLFFYNLYGQSLLEEQQTKFNEYKSHTFENLQVKFAEGEFSLFSSGTEASGDRNASTGIYGFRQIEAQKAKLDENTYDASGMILIKESSQEIFWNSNKSDIQGKIFAFVDDCPAGLESIQQSTPVNGLDYNTKMRMSNLIYRSINANPSALNIVVDKPTMSKLEFKEYNGYTAAYRKVKAKSKGSLTIHSYIFFLEKGKLLDFKVIIADDDRKLIVEDLIDKTLNSMVFYGITGKAESEPANKPDKKKVNSMDVEIF